MGEREQEQEGEKVGEGERGIERSKLRRLVEESKGVDKSLDSKVVEEVGVLVAG